MKMKCPACKSKVTKIGVVCEYTQVYDTVTEDWDNSDSSVGDTIYTFCMECGSKLPERFNKIVD